MALGYLDDVFPGGETLQFYAVHAAGKRFAMSHFGVSEGVENLHRNVSCPCNAEVQRSPLEGNCCRCGRCNGADCVGAAAGFAGIAFRGLGARRGFLAFGGCRGLRFGVA